MAVIQSLVLGTSGSYEIAGIPVTFEEYNKTKYPSRSEAPTIDNSLISSFRVLNQSFVHIFVHEMGHALTARLLTDNRPHIHIFNNEYGGETRTYKSDSQWKNSVAILGGPLLNMVFSCIKLAAAVLINKHISKGVSYYLGVNALDWMLVELSYTFRTGLGVAEGDFNFFDNPIHLRIALLAMISTCALGIFASIKLHAHINT